jgi:hypothetical protein
MKAALEKSIFEFGHPDITVNISEELGKEELP